LTELSQDAPTPEVEGELFGRIRGRIVGIRYYDGVAHAGEYVKLAREPENPYDRNAIRVENMLGEKVGHIRAGQAAALAPVMDTYAGTFLLDAIVPDRGNLTSLPVQIDLLGPPELAEDILRDLHMRGLNASLDHAELKGVVVVKEPVLVVQRRLVDWKEQVKNLDMLFEEQTKAQVEKLPMVDFDRLPLQTPLFPHQKVGIRWLKHKESGKEAVPFYRKIREGGREVWLSEITNSSQATEPQPVRGAILADDMGLGKTLQAIGLILANPPEGTDYARAAENLTREDDIEEDRGPTAPTLIICPVSVTSSWVEQVEMHVLPDALRVALYTGAGREDLLRQLDQLDVVVASYDTLGYDYAKIFCDKKGERPSSTSSSIG